MKKLQCNFTTPEQSKRLLELGVPADSADLFYYSLNKINQSLGKFDLCIVGNTTISSLKETADEEGLIVIPCWSVGRLIEIMKICAKPKEQETMVEEMLYCKDLVELLVYMIEANEQVIDFSKFDG